MSWFTKPHVPPQERFEHVPPKEQLRYPMWTFAKVAGMNDYWLILDKTRMKFISERAFLSWGHPAIIVSEESIAGYMVWKPIGFAPGTLIISEADNTKWYITGADPLAAIRRQVTTPDFYIKLGFDLDDAYVVSLTEVDHHKKGEDISGISL